MWSMAKKASSARSGKSMFRPRLIRVLTNGHVSVIDEFLDAIENGREPETSGRDNIKSLAMVFAAIESAAARRRIQIDVQEAA